MHTLLPVFTKTINALFAITLFLHNNDQIDLKVELSLCSIEIICAARENLLPDPATDPVVAVALTFLLAVSERKVDM